MYKPVFTITPDILNAIGEISSIKTMVETSRVLPLNEAQLKRQAMIRMVHTSTSIEGNKLAEFQVDKVLSGMSVSADQRSIQEVKNYQAAIKEIDKLASQEGHLTITKILDLHKILMKGLLPEEKQGAWRSGPIYVVDDLGDGREQLRFEGPLAEKVLFLINELLTWLEHSEKEKLHPILRAGIFHLQFVSIHPFPDGNGRMTRLLTQYILYKAGWDFRKIIVLEDFYNTDRQEYYNAENEIQGHKYHEGQDMTNWLDYFVLGFLVEARKVRDGIKAVGFSKKDADSQIFLDRDEIQIMDFLTTTGQITSRDVEEILKIAKRTAQLKLKNLVDKKLIKMEGKGPASYYTLT
jgi:Fic family protein